MLRKESFHWRDLVSPWALLLVWLPIALISVLHFSTYASLHALHDVYRRLYYLPIILAGFALGTRGALAASLVASVIYAPHAFTMVWHHDPADPVEKILEILLYNVVALVVGGLADRQHREQRRQEQTARELAQALATKEEMEKLLIRAARLQALGEMTAGMAHEIKNPLASIRGAAEAVIDELRADSPRQRMATILRKEIQRLETILERFLNFARSEEYDLVSLSLGEQLRRLEALMEAQARQQNVTLRVDPSSTDVRAHGEKDKVFQVLMNVVLNAIQASPPGGTVRLTCRRDVRGGRRYSSFVVEDDGPGVPVELREKIFNPFFSGRHDGSGLGLAIAAKIVDQHGGFIEVGDASGGGARFEVFLPAEPSA